MGKNLVDTVHTLFLCDGGSCQKAGSEMVTRTARAYLRNNGLWDSVHTIKTRCNGRCEDAPTCIVSPGEFWYKELTPEKITSIMQSHLYQKCPIEAELIYQRGWDKLVSDKERKKVTPKPFELKNDGKENQYWVTKGFSSDQYLYPLFQYILENKINGKITLPNGQSIDLKSLESIVYSKAYTMEIGFTDVPTINLIIGVVPQTASSEIRDKKITATEYRLLMSGDKMIQFKNNKGHLIMAITFPKEDTKIWDYCTKIQLGGIVPPEIINYSK